MANGGTYYLLSFLVKQSRKRELLDLLLFLLVVVPVIGVLWFLNLVSLLKKIKENRDPHKQVLLGAVMTFFFVFMFSFIVASMLTE